jgi:hypothetical protein
MHNNTIADEISATFLLVAIVLCVFILAVWAYAGHIE